MQLRCNGSTFLSNVGMIAKYARQVSSRQASASTPTVTKSFARQFSRQQSTQAVEASDDEEVYKLVLHEYY